MELSDLFAGRLDISDALVRLQQVAAEVGLPLGDNTRIFNSRRAQELGKWAEELGCGNAFRDAVFRAYFVEGRNIAKPEELKLIAESAGLPVDDAVRVLDEDRFATAVDADWERALAFGITAVPTHIYGRYKLVGFHPYEALRRLVTS
jgi:predicted DsbA family dithiol-disulfide isomerase